MLSCCPDGCVKPPGGVQPLKHPTQCGTTMIHEPALSDDSVLAMNEVYVGHKFGPLAPTLKSDLAVVEHLKFRPVRNADDGCCAELLGQEFHHMVLADGIERRCRLIEHNDVRPMKEDPGECKSLLLL